MNQGILYCFGAATELYVRLHEVLWVVGHVRPLVLSALSSSPLASKEAK